LKGAGFNTDTNVVKFLYPDGKIEELAQMSKTQVAEELLNRVMARKKK
jgi:phosphopantothenoylcysteine decarboxylase/phosphopantothenate--cysteine ligase